jgi:hypothetical protein
MQNRWQAVLDVANRIDHEPGVNLQYLMRGLAKHFEDIQCGDAER